MDSITEKLKKILGDNKDKRISVVGTICVGKTTLLKDIPDGIAISKLAPPLTEDEKIFYYNPPFTKESYEKKFDMRARRAFVETGQPCFGTAFASGTELIVYLTISDALLKQRTESRNVDFAQSKIMQGFIEENIKESGLPIIELFLG